MFSPQFLTILSASVLISTGANAAISYVTVGSTYSENFDRAAFTAADETDASWSNDGTVPGWYWINNAGTTPTTFRASDTSSATQGRILSLGTAGGSDRALGHQSSNSVTTIRYGVQILNSTSTVLDSFSLAYKGEQWRRPSGQAAETLVFEYQIFAAGTLNPLAVTTGWTSVSSLDFSTPNTVGSSSGLDGNLPENSASLSGNATGLSWAPGQELWLRWSDSGEASAKLAAIGIDDVTFSAVPEPSAALLGGVALFGLLVRRRG